MPTSHATACHPQDTAPPSRLAVVYSVSGSLANIQKTLECLQAQSAADRIDLFVTADSPTLLQEAEAFVRERGVLVNPRFLLQQSTDLAAARLVAAQQASAEFITIAEDHSFPDANFAEEILEVFASCSRILAASPNMHNPNPAAAVSRAQFLLTHGFVEPGSGVLRTEEIERLPWHNTTYRREAFLAAAHDEGFVRVESLLQEEIWRLFPRARFVHCHRTALWHVNMSLLAPAVGHAFDGGRIYGAECARYRQWGFGARLLHSLAFPLVALLRIARRVHRLVDHQSVGRGIATLSFACLLAFCQAVGEAIGTLWGPGKIDYTRYECDRTRQVRAGERHLLVSRAAVQDPSAGARAEEASRPTA